MTSKPVFQAAVMIVLALVVAVVANAFASRQRRLVLPGYYPHALRVPPRVPERVLPPVTTSTATTTTAATTTMAQSPAPGQPPMVIETSTIARPAGTPATATAPPAATATTTAAAPVPAPAQPAADPLARFKPHPEKAYIEISGEDAALLHSRGVLFLDARRTSVYEEGHIAGARTFSVWESDIDDKVNALFSERDDPQDQNLPIVIYCSGGACEDSHMLSEKLWGIQFNNVYVYKDGFPDWQKRGGPVRSGGQP